MRIYKTPDTFTISNPRISIFFSVLIILLAALIRSRLNFSQELIPGVNGGYYPLLTRNLLEFKSINYPDAPLVHWLIAGLSWLIGQLSNLDREPSILLATRLTDTLIPVLAGIPVLLAAKELLRYDSKNRWFALLLAAFSVLYLSPLMLFSSDMIKNSVGLVWVSLFLFVYPRFLADRRKKDLLISVSVLILTGLTHVGSLALEIIFIIITGLLSLFRGIRTIRSRQWILVLIILIAVVLVSLLLFQGDPDRLERIRSFYRNPFRIFEFPYLFLLLQGQNPYPGFLFHNFLIINILSISGLIFLLTGFKRFNPDQQNIALGLSLLSLIISSPLIGMEWTLRYHLMAFLPLSFLYLYLCRLIFTKTIKAGLIGFFTVIVLGSALIGANSIRQPAISDKSFRDLSVIGKQVKISPEDIIVARHGLEWWTGWVLHCRTGKEYCLSPADWDSYRKVYLLRQKEGNNYPGHQGTSQFTRIRIPGSAVWVYSSGFFDLYELARPQAGEFYPGELPLLQGRIESVSDRSIEILADGYRQEVLFSGSTSHPGFQPEEAEPGMLADVWGHRVPFSLKIKSDIILITN